MTCRPVDSAGDILPVLSPASLLSGAPAAAAALSDHLRLFSRDWWEYPLRGNPVFDLLAAGPLRDGDLPALSACATSYVLEFPAVRSVSDVHVSRSGSVMTYTATAHTFDGASASVTLSAP